jgi:hypothetical protein
MAAAAGPSAGWVIDRSSSSYAVLWLPFCARPKLMESNACVCVQLCGGDAPAGPRLHLPATSCLRWHHQANHHILYYSIPCFLCFFPHKKRKLRLWSDGSDFSFLICWRDCRLYICYFCPFAQRAWVTRNFKVLLLSVLLPLHKWKFTAKPNNNLISFDFHLQGLQDKMELVAIDLQDKPAWYKEKVYPQGTVCWVYSCTCPPSWAWASSSWTL